MNSLFLINFIFIICFFKMTEAKAPRYVSYFFIHPVGQGQWNTHVTNDMCEHFDFGGEIIFSKNIKKIFLKHCSNKINKLHLSHAHLDHYSFLELILKNSVLTCWQTKAIDEIVGFYGLVAKQIPDCSNIKKSKSKIIFYDPTGNTKNERSIVQTLNTILLPGDSIAKAEKKWVHLARLDTIKILILAHHGSQTSTSDMLIRNLPSLQMAFASARFQRFKHPSSKIILRLKKYKLPLIKIEDWGSVLLL